VTTPNSFRAALTLAAAFHECSIALHPAPVTPNDDTVTHFAELTPTNVILLYVTAPTPYSLDLYDSLFAQVDAHRIAVERDGDGPMTVFTYAFGPTP
jgi:hypothetical protein